MTQCNHKNLTLIPPQTGKLRCCQCHLTIDPEELNKDYCPECYESRGMKQYDFEKLEPEDDGKTRYRCEDCGAIITS